MSENKEVATREDTPLARLQKTGEEIDKIIGETLPVSSKAAQGFVDSLVIAKGIADLRHIMVSSHEVKRTVMHMANNRLGFMTDRTPAAIASNKRKQKGPQREYTFEELVDPVIEGLLKGYRISGNEMNIIAGNFYAAKAGSYRLVTEWPGVTDFKYGNSPVQYSSNGNQYARVKCWATWKLNGKEMGIGVDEKDDCTLQIRINAMMGEDGLIGKAHSKLFKRALERISGQVMPEATDIDPTDFIDAEVVTHAEIPETGERNLDVLENAASETTQPGRETTTPPESQGMLNRNSGANSHPPENTRLDGLPQWNENHPFWPDKWAKMRTGDGVKTGLSAYIRANESAVGSMPENEQRNLVDKFERIYENMRFPYPLPWMNSGETDGNIGGSEKDQDGQGLQKQGAPQDESKDKSANGPSIRDRFLQVLAEYGVDDDEIGDVNAYVHHVMTKTKSTPQEIQQGAIEEPKQFIEWFRGWVSRQQDGDDDQQQYMDENMEDLQNQLISLSHGPTAERYKQVVNAMVSAGDLPGTFVNQWANYQCRKVIDAVNEQF